MKKQVVLTNHRIKFLDSGPVGKYVDSLVELLVKQGFSTDYIPRRLGIIADLNRWLIDQGLEITELDHQKIARFKSAYNNRLEVTIDRGVHKTSLNTFLNLLQSNGIIKLPKTFTKLNPIEKVLHNFDEYLNEQRGLSKSTRIYYKKYIRKFLFEVFGRKRINLNKLSVKNILCFIRKLSGFVPPKQSQLATTSLRSFFRYIRLIGKINIDLSGSVPTVANKIGENIPQTLTAEEVNRMLTTCNQSEPVGIRNYAILLLLSRLGLRSCEVIRLKLDDIDWNNSAIAVQRKGANQDLLPMDHEIGNAIVRYLKYGRPAHQGRELFLSALPPIRRIGSSATIGTIVRTALERAGLNPKNKGAHLLRHTVATQILKNGGTLPEVGSILGHQSLQTTAIYAKVDFGRLIALAKPWPCSLNGGSI